MFPKIVSAERTKQELKEKVDPEGRACRSVKDDRNSPPCRELRAAAQAHPPRPLGDAPATAPAPRTLRKGRVSTRARARALLPRTRCAAPGPAAERRAADPSLTPAARARVARGSTRHCCKCAAARAGRRGGGAGGRGEEEGRGGEREAAPRRQCPDGG